MRHMNHGTESAVLSISRLSSPLGDLLGAIDGAGALVRLDFFDGKARPRDEDELSRTLAAQGFLTREDPRPFAAVRTALERYFDGRPQTLERLPIAPVGTEFQLRVWGALRRVSVGSTTTYGALAKSIGRPGAARAVGAANGANTLAILIPCHRVIGADGSLTGYAGGLKRKRALLQLEASQIPG